jgi:hypothetical protein
MATATAPVFDVPGYKIATAPDLSRPETRTRLSPTALKVFFAIVEEWRLSMSQAADLLGKSRSGIYKLRGSQTVLSQDELTRISYLIGINKALHVVFPRKLAGEWMIRPNDHPLFHGETPLAYVTRAGIPGLELVRRMLDAERTGN